MEEGTAVFCVDLARGEEQVSVVVIVVVCERVGDEKRAKKTHYLDSPPDHRSMSFPEGTNPGPGLPSTATTAEEPGDF